MCSGAAADGRRSAGGPRHPALTEVTRIPHIKRTARVQPPAFHRSQHVPAINAARHLPLAPSAILSVKIGPRWSQSNRTGKTRKGGNWCTALAKAEPASVGACALGGVTEAALLHKWTWTTRDMHAACWLTGYRCCINYKLRPARLNERWPWELVIEQT